MTRCPTRGKTSIDGRVCEELDIPDPDIHEDGATGVGGSGKTHTGNGAGNTDCVSWVATKQLISHSCITRLYGGARRMGVGDMEKAADFLLGTCI